LVLDEIAKVNWPANTEARLKKYAPKEEAKPESSSILLPPGTDA
jgi:hypothetical protein